MKKRQELRHAFSRALRKSSIVHRRHLVSCGALGLVDSGSDGGGGASREVGVGDTRADDVADASILDELPFFVVGAIRIYKKDIRLDDIQQWSEIKLAQIRSDIDFLDAAQGFEHILAFLLVVEGGTVFEEEDGAI